jgi:hypothetical protein
VTPSPASQTPLEATPPSDSLSRLPAITQPTSTSQLASGPSVFELLSRLNPGVPSSGQPNPSRPHSGSNASQKGVTAPHSGPSGPSGLDLRYMTVQQALPHISKLVQRADFRDKIKKVSEYCTLSLNVGFTGAFFSM